MLTLTVQKRTSKENLNASRKGGKIPAVFYGRKEKSTPVWVSEADLIRVWKKAGETSIVELKGEANDLQALIHDIDMDPVTDTIRHADFYVIEKDKKLEVQIPINFVGVSSAVKDLGGILVKVRHGLKIEALPKDLPHSVTVDIGTLATFDSQILAKEIQLPVGVVLKDKEDEVIAAIDRPREEKEEEAAPIDLSAIEVQKKGKEPVEGEVAEGGADTAKKEPAGKK